MVLFFKTKVAKSLIFLNVFLFFYFIYVQRQGGKLDAFFLYPGNLLEGRLWTLITSGFIHHDIKHLFFNMLGVFIFAPIVERQLGVEKTLFIYFGAMIISMFSATCIYAFFVKKSVVIIGASGAVMGLISAAMLVEPFCITYEMIFPLPIMVKGWLFFYADIIGLLGAEKDGISHLTHLIGFLSIAILIYFLSEKDKRKLRVGFMVNILSFIACAAFIYWLNMQAGRVY